jgi:hypothetical protein
MGDAAVIRIFQFRAARRGFDETVRKVLLPDLRAFPGVVDVICGRRGPDESGPRILVTTWSSMDAMVDSVGDRLGVFHPELMDHSTDQVLEFFPVRLGGPVHDGSARLLRILRGTVRPSELGAYIDDVRAGVDEDTAGGAAPTVIYLAETGPDSFLTVSAWCTWDDVERATGGDVHRPVATRKPQRLVDWDVEYYEIVPT